VSGDAIPGISNCIEGDPGAEPDSDFMTAIENAIPIDPTTTLVNGAYTAIDYYANDTSSNCNPFRNSQSCQRNFILMISSGVGADNPPTPSGGSPNVFSDATNCTGTNDPPASYNLAKNTCFGYSNDLRNSPTFGGENLPGRQVVGTYIVNTMGVPRDNDTGTNTAGDILYQAANAGGGVYYEVTDPATLRESLIQAFQDILKRAAAGTAASVLASGEGSGANLIQAVFYPRRKVRDAEIAWTGRLTNFWYFVDPFFSQSSIYEDNASSKYFNRTEDNKVTFFFDTTFERTMAHRYPPSGTLPDIEFEKLESLWETGIQLWQRDHTTRNIKVSTGSGVVDFTTANAGALRPLFDLPAADSNGDGFADGDLDHDGDLSDDDAGMLIRYIQGEDFPASPWMRSRTVSIDLNNNDTIDAGETNVWKLGDILNSTPKISSWIPLNTYHDLYKDNSYKTFICPDKNPAVLCDSGYRNRGMVFAGGNDGMLHAFKLGKLELKSNPFPTCSFSSTDVACLANPAGYLGGSGVPLGHEVWSFIPKNVLPYLKFKKEPDYCHVFTVDLSPYIFDASIGAPASGDISGDVRAIDGSTWRTIVIGGMRYGGACKNSCTSANCVQNPVNDLGYSSYFALDVTDQSSPTLLWEFSNENLGFTTTGPVVVRVGDETQNGKWFVVVGSGPTGPISTTDQQFLARSDQNLRFFVIDAKTGNLARTIDTGITEAFAGSMINATMDVDLNYKDDVVYTGYVKKALLGTWTHGGVGRLQTKQSTNPADWEWSQVIDNIGPVTSAVTRLLNKGKGQLWIFFGSGRYYFEQQATVDDENGQRSLFGIKEPCYSASGLDANCTTTFSGSLTDVSNTPNADPSAISDGWRIDLDASGNYTYAEGNPPVPVTRYYRAERVITDPLTTTSGLVFFVSYKPYSDVCAYGGKSFIWAAKYNTGGAPGALLKGVALLQVSTGSIEQLNLSEAFTEKGGRRTSALEGVPPTAQGLSILSTPPPVKRVIHIKER
jgi:type IV pilus assembly protein PilY1